MSLVGRCKCLKHQTFLRKLTGETAIQFSTKAAHAYGLSSRQNGLLQARMMPAQLHSFGARTGVWCSGGSLRHCCRSEVDGG
jgi:hypothetical protein